jgi:DNA-binding beta-propeller fold protein YncE
MIPPLRNVMEDPMARMFAVLLACACGIALASAQNPGAAATAPGAAQVDDALTGIKNPCGVAVQPETGTVWVGHADGVTRFFPTSPSANDHVIRGFKSDIYGKGPMYDIAALGLEFLDKDTLFVGGGDLVDGQELMYLFNVKSLPAKAGSAFITVKDAKTFGPIAPSDESKMGEGNFYGLAHDKNGLYITSNGDDTKGWVLKIPLKDGKPAGKLQTFIATKVATDVDAPVGIAMNKQGHILVGQMGEINVPKDSLLTAYDPTTGKLLWKAETGLHDIAALAHHPKTGKLYALDYAWMKPEDGGLFELTVEQTSAGKVAVKATKVAPLSFPTAMAFAPDGTLYATVIQKPQVEGKPMEKNGKLVRIKGL